MPAVEARPRPAVGWGELIIEGRGSRFALVCLGSWLGAAEALMTATVMPSVAADIGGYAWFGWVVALYLTGSILAGATAGRLSIRLGLRRAMILGGVAYGLGCAACALAPTIGLFLAGRLLQGIGGGWIAGLCFVAVSALFPERLWSRVFSAMAGVWGAATLISPLVGGLFAQMGFWRGAFWLFAAQGLGFLVAAAALIRRDAAPGEIGSARPPWGPLTTLAAGIVGVGLAGLVGRAEWAVLLSAGGVLLLLLFIYLNARSDAPLLPRQAANPFSGAGAGLALVFCFAAANASFGVYGAALFQALHGASPVLAGYVLCAEAMGWTVAALVSAGRPGAGGYIRIGAVLITLGLAGLALGVPHGPLWWAAGCGLLQGVGFGLAWAFTASRIIGDTPPPERALASASVPTTQSIGTAVGAAAAGVIANLLGFGQGVSAARATVGGFWLFAAFVPLALIGLAAAWRLGSARFAEPDEAPAANTVNKD